MKLRAALALTALAVVAVLVMLALRGSAKPSARRDRQDTLAPTAVEANQRVEPAEKNDPERAPAAPPVQRAANEAPVEPTPALRAAFEREAPDATAHSAEAQLRAIYAAERDADIILRDVRCTRSVCKLTLRWSPELNAPYNNALNNTLKDFSRDIDLTPDITLGGPETPIPMTLYVARPGHSVASLLAEQTSL